MFFSIPWAPALSNEKKHAKKGTTKWPLLHGGMHGVSILTSLSNLECDGGQKSACQKKHYFAAPHLEIFETFDFSSHKCFFATPGVCRSGRFWMQISTMSWWWWCHPSCHTMMEEIYMTKTHSAYTYCTHSPMYSTMYRPVCAVQHAHIVFFMCDVDHFCIHHDIMTWNFAQHDELPMSVLCRNMPKMRSFTVFLACMTEKTSFSMKLSKLFIFVMSFWCYDASFLDQFLNSTYVKVA